MWAKILELSNQHGYMSGVDRMSDRVKATGEVFTPTLLTIKIMQQMLKINDSIFAPGKTILDPAVGDGQLVVPVKWYKVLRYGISEEEAVKDIYGVDIMRDNVDLCKKRLGGGNIIMSNTLDPYTKLDEQTEEEYNLGLEWFGEDNLTAFFG